VTPPAWRATDRVLLVGGSIYSPASPFATAMLVDGDEVAWLGEDSAAAAHRDSADRVVDLRGALVTPGFVDAHVHATSTGLTLTGLDLSRTASLGEALALLEARAREVRGAPIIGHGWDETRWPEARPPSREEVDRSTWGSVVYLSRIDVHSAVVSSALAAQVPGLRDKAGWDPIGPLSQHAHHAVREAILGTIGAGQRAAAHRVMRDRAAALGIVSMHEMAGPTISSEDDLAELLALSAGEPGPTVVGYWGQLAREGGLDRARELGALGVAGDLFVDGAIGSRTACLCAPYSDAPDRSGAGYLDADEIAEHVVAATEAGMQAGFHVIGDAASDAVVTGLRTATERVGLPAMRAAMHRLEHAELLTDDHVHALAELGVTASMQPMFDGLWGGPGGMYEQRLGAARAAGMNRFADLVSSGVLVAFGSDAPVTDLGPWAAVRAAVHPTNPGQALSTRAAFGAHTRSGWRAIGQPESGTLAPGAPAHLAIWAVDDIVVQAPDERVAAWSTDPRSGTPGLPPLAPDLPLPRCLRTIVHGRTVFDSGELDPS
jgi:predicted amidohydrolase YtcJ